MINAAKKLLALGLLVLCVGPASFADVWKLAASYPTPGPNPRGYCGGSPEAGYIVMGGVRPYVYHYWWERGSIVSSFPAPGGVGAWGILRLHDEFFITNNRTSWIYKTTKQGSVVGSFRCPFDGPADLELKGFSPTGIMVAIPNRNIIAVLNPTTGSLVATYAGPGRRPVGCYGYVRFHILDSATHTVYENGVPIITGIQDPVGLGGLTGMAPPYDVHLYVVDDATNRYYFYVHPGATVFPSSLGRVKALFR